tara:strand:- start:3139 stop:3639 length:501 start_codon:yes stop_codon:yes gene_type:complete
MSFSRLVACHFFDKIMLHGTLKDLCTNTHRQGKGTVNVVNCSILIVDDSEDFLNLLLTYLDDTGCTVAVARDGEDAVDLCERKRFDLIIMDIIMPLMDGVDAIRAIRRMEAQTRRSPTPILAISGEGSLQTGVDSMDAGATRMLVKPITGQDLQSTVMEMMGKTTR